jgi:hypothetical protein
MVQPHRGELLAAQLDEAELGAGVHHDVDHGRAGGGGGGQDLRHHRVEQLADHVLVHDALGVSGTS